MKKIIHEEQPKPVWYVYDMKTVYESLLISTIEQEDEFENGYESYCVIKILNWDFNDLHDHHATFYYRIVPSHAVFVNIEEASQYREILIDEQIQYLDTLVRKELYEFK